jgi:hypothetical protein
LACPYFMPTHKSEDVAWLHPSRLPLGAGWAGHCYAPSHEGSVPTSEELKELCNLGYAASCPRLPKERTSDAVRFAVARESESHLFLWFVCEAAHRPAQSGQLDYNASLGQWNSSHADARIQKMAECYVQSYLLRKPQPATSSPNS